MGIRNRAYWQRQAYALRRQNIELIAHAVSIAMATKEDKERALDELELKETVEESRKKRSEATWNMLYFIGKGGSGKGSHV